MGRQSLTRKRKSKRPLPRHVSLSCASRLRVATIQLYRLQAKEGETRLRKFIATLAFCIVMSSPAFAGPPYVTDDPEPTDYQHFEIYAFSAGTATRDGRENETGIDFNYGGAPNLQLNTNIALVNDDPRGAHGILGIGNIEFGAKYEF